MSCHSVTLVWCRYHSQPHCASNRDINLSHTKTHCTSSSLRRHLTCHMFSPSRHVSFSQLTTWQAVYQTNLKEWNGCQTKDDIKVFRIKFTTSPRWTLNVIKMNNSHLRHLSSSAKLKDKICCSLLCFTTSLSNLTWFSASSKYLKKEMATLFYQNYVLDNSKFDLTTFVSWKTSQ